MSPYPYPFYSILGPCDESSLSKIGDFDLCTRAESQVNLLIPDTVDPLLVERVAIADIQTFVAEFNSESENIQILFEYPLSVSAVVKVSLIGVDGTMGTGEKLALEKTLRDIFGPILQANDPAFSIDTLQVLLQEAENVRRRSLRRALQNDNGQQVPVNNVDLYLRATCSGGDCTNQFFETALLLEMGAITEALEIALRAAGREQGTDYFESLTRVQVADSGLGEVLPAPFTDEYQETEDSKIPAWVWVVLALDFVIILVALGWVMMRLRRRENEEAASKYDDYQAPDEASGFPEYTEDERQSLPAGQASFGSDDSD